MGVDLSKLTDEQLLSLRAGNLNKLPDDVLLSMRETPRRQQQKTTMSDILRGSVPGRFFTGVEDPIIGSAQLGARALPGNMDKSMDSFVQDREASIRRGRAATGSEGFDASRMVGNMVLPMILGGKRIPTTVKGRIGLGTGTGTAMGATAPVEDTENYALNKGYQMGAGGILGGLIPGGMELTRLGGRTIKHLLEPLDWFGGKTAIKGREYNLAAGKKRDAILSNIDDADPKVFRERYNTDNPRGVEPQLNLQKQGQLVPGSKPTAAEAAAPAGGAKFAGLQRNVSSKKPDEYLDRAHEQQAARTASLATIARTKEELKEAVKIRTKNAKANYEKTYDAEIKLHTPTKLSYNQKILRPDAKPVDKGIFVDKTLNRLERHPSFKKAYTASVEIAKDQGWSHKKQPARLLHTMKTYMDAQLDAGPNHPNALNKAQALGVKSTKKELVDWMNKNIPGYDDARQQFKAESGPINRMLVGQELEKVLSPPISDIAEVGSQRAGPFAQSIRDSSQIIKKTGQDPRFNELKDILTPDEMKRVDGIASDLARRAQYEEQARAGSAATQGNVASAQLKRETGSSTAPNALYHPIMIFNAVVKRLQGKASTEIEEQMAEEMLDGKVVADIMRKAMIPQKRIDRFVKAFNAAQLPAVAGAVSANNRGLDYIHPH